MGFESTPSWLRFSLLVLWSASAACGVSDRHVSLASGGEAGVAGSAVPGGAGTGASAGASNVAGEAGAGAAGEAEAAGAAGEPGCSVKAAPYCADNFTPVRCVAGAWVEQTACSGNEPECSRGLCGNATLYGGIATVVPAPSTRGIRIVDQGFEFAQPVAPATTSCAEVRKGLTVCLTGGLTAHAVVPAMASGGSGS